MLVARHFRKMRTEQSTGPSRGIGTAVTAVSAVTRWATAVASAAASVVRASAEQVAADDDDSYLPVFSSLFFCPSL